MSEISWCLRWLEWEVQSVWISGPPIREEIYETAYREDHTGMVKGGCSEAQNPVRWSSGVTELSRQTAVIAIKVHLLIRIRWWIFMQSSLLHDLFNHLTLCRNLIWFFQLVRNPCLWGGTANLASIYKRYDGEDICLYSRMNRGQFSLKKPTSP